MSPNTSPVSQKNKGYHLGNLVSKVGLDLVESMSSVLAGVPGAPSRPQQIAKNLELNKDLTSRLVRAIKRSDPIEALAIMPGPAPLMRVLKSASLAGVPQQVIVRAETAIQEFENLIRTEFGARADFDAAISFVHPQARERQESISKQLAYRGASGLRGVSVDVLLVSFLVHPSEHSQGWCDTAVINAYIGLRRTRPNAPVEFTTFQEGRSTRNHDASERSTARTSGHLLREYCSPEELPLDVVQVGNKLRYTLLDNGIGHSSAIDLVTHEYYEQNHPQRPVQGQDRVRWFFATTDQPAVLLIFDLFLHKDVWQDCQPNLTIYDTAVKGLAEPTDSSRDGDRLDLYESITPLGNIPFASRVPEISKYSAMQKHVCGMHNWNIEDFRGYRVRATYPFHGSQICMVFHPFENQQQILGNAST